MTTTPISDNDRARMKVLLEEMTERRDLLDIGISRLQERLDNGTTWCYEPGAFQTMCEIVEEDARRRREESERLEIEQYGRILTDFERKNCPPEKIQPT